MYESTLNTMIEEYKICVSEANRVESLIWKSSSILGIFSCAGLLIQLINNENNNEESLIIKLFFSIIIITTFIAWFRLRKRWSSIQHLKYSRLNFIEKEIKSQFGYPFLQNQMVDITDKIKRKREKIDYQSSELSKIGIKKNSLYCYEHRGIVPIIDFFIGLNIIIWVAIAVWIIFQIENNLLKMSIYSLLVVYSFILYNSYIKD